MLKGFVSIIAIGCLLLSNLSAQQTEVVYLSGTGYDDTREWDFYCSAGMNSGKWSKINVPSHWEQEGFGEYTYGRWYKQRGKSPSDETGHYKTTFEAPKFWKNKTINLVFEGVMTDTRVLINGQQAGEIHQGGFYRFRYDISDLVVPDEENLLEVLVSKHSADRTVNAAERMADWWLFGGIYRPVYLEILPETHISAIRTDPKGDGTFNAKVNISEPGIATSVKGTLTDSQGNRIGSFEHALREQESFAWISHAFSNIQPWTPETPHLYHIELTLLRKNKPLHTHTERIGFRTIEVRPEDGIYCNGTKIILKGINRHTFWPESGRSTSKHISIMDASLIKEMNMNAVRGHYPTDKHFLDACDSLGLFYINELAGWQNAYRTEIGTKLVREMVERDVNHPSVIIWSNGNEGGWNEEVDPLFAALDPQKRTVIHPWADYGDIDTHHYPQYQTGVHRFNDGFRIFMPTEFLHGLYDEGHGAGLEDFWAKWTTHPLFAGGFTWAFSDCAIKRSDTGLHDSDGQHAPDGILGPYREKEGSFFTIKDVWAPIQFDPMFINPSFTGEFSISNHYLFTNLEACRMSYQLFSIPGPWEQNRQQQLLASGNIPLPSVLPGEKRKIHMELPENFFEGDLLAVTAHDPYGKEIYTWTWPLRFTGEFLEKKKVTRTGDESAGFSITGNTVTLQADGTEISFNRTTGIIEKIHTPAGEIPFNGGPVPVGMKAAPDRSEARTEGDLAVFTTWYKGGIDSIRWEMTPDARLKMSMIALNKATNDGGFDGGYIEDKIDLWGITFNFPEQEATGIEWFGKGPYRVWKNRQRGTTFGHWQKDYNNTITGESFENLVYPEFKGYHANLYWAELAARQAGPLTIASESDGLFLRLFTPEEPKGSLRASLPRFPDGDISFLYEINPIRAFKPVSQMGPKSEPNSVRIKKGDRGIAMNIWFDFTDR
ncbi:MAG: glycoside hydrolase family 2 TIM barrel-domain containing protein [Bacteroidales bacterium]|nr:glycoside hydrolase family 2 TIM barrel-domain containing protein [Bacteroidales bacterium]MDT8430173.1 glycoside hydrolase family 2 TIM barrel-domain containing protein [Bacteroidales bacterium]